MSDNLTLDKNNIPLHVAVIMDGNGRWAQQRGKLRIFGHKNAVTAVRETVEVTATGVKFLTLYAFSTENWNRPKDEVDGLMSLLVESIGNEIQKLHKNNIRFTTIGDFDSLPAKTKAELNKAKELTRNNTHMTLIVALSYSSKWEIIKAIKEIAKEAKEGKLNIDDINEDVFSNHLNTASIPDPELLIRTSGEQRISNFLMWQLAYAELYFTEKLWPDFRKPDFIEAIHNYQQRERRFGKTGEQIKKK